MLTSVLCVCVVTNILHEGLHIVSFYLGCCTSNYNLPATLPPGEGIGEGKNFHLALLLTVRTGHPGRGVPTGSLSVFLRQWKHGTMLTIYGGAWDDRKGRPYAKKQQVTHKKHRKSLDFRCFVIQDAIRSGCCPGRCISCGSPNGHPLIPLRCNRPGRLPPRWRFRRRSALRSVRSAEECFLSRRWQWKSPSHGLAPIGSPGHLAVCRGSVGGWCRVSANPRTVWVW